MCFLFGFGFQLSHQHTLLILESTSIRVGGVEAPQINGYISISL
jgi:hypothetical protein